MTTLCCTLLSVGPGLYGVSTLSVESKNACGLWAEYSMNHDQQVRAGNAVGIKDPTRKRLFFVLVQEHESFACEQGTNDALRTCRNDALIIAFKIPFLALWIQVEALKHVEEEINMAMQRRLAAADTNLRQVLDLVRIGVKVTHSMLYMHECCHWRCRRGTTCKNKVTILVQGICDNPVFFWVCT